MMEHSFSDGRRHAGLWPGLAAHRRGLRRRALCWGLALGFLLTAGASAAAARYERLCDAVCADTLRLHILANSDAPADQALKLRVRDALLRQLAPALEGARSRRDAADRVAAALPAIADTALRTVRAAGSPQPVAVRLEKIPFAARDYGSFALPAGKYLALRVSLGAAAGHNWFCVLYPALCTGAAAGRYEQPAENALVFGRYEVRFALLDAARNAWQDRRKQADRAAPARAPATAETALKSGK